HGLGPRVAGVAAARIDSADVVKQETERRRPGLIPWAPSPLPVYPLIRFHFLRERTRHRARHGLLRRRRGLEALGRLDLDLVISVDARPRRDEMAYDDVLLQAQQVVVCAPNRRVGQDPGGLLELG